MLETNVFHRLFIYSFTGRFLISISWSIVTFFWIHAPFSPLWPSVLVNRKKDHLTQERTKIYNFVLIIYMGITCLKEGDSQNKNHPNIYPLDIGRGQNRLWDANEAGMTKLYFRNFCLLGIKQGNLTSEILKKGKTEWEWWVSEWNNHF